MTQEQKNSFIGLFALVLVIGGIYYFKNRADNAPIPPEEVNIEDINTPPVTPLTPEEETINKANQANSEELKAQEAVRKAKWNKAMDNARTAFGKGEYDKALAFYNEALSYYKTDTGYAGLFFVYSAQNNTEKARAALDSAIQINPKFSEYWKSKLTLLDEKTNISFADLKKIYQDGLAKVDGSTKINLVTHFAGIAESNGQNAEAIAVWEYAKELYPQNSSIYQGEIERLQNM